MPCLSTKYDRVSDLLGVVFEWRERLFSATIFEKLKDRHLHLPVWSEQRPDSIFDSQETAVRHLKRLFDIERRKQARLPAPAPYGMQRLTLSDVTTLIHDDIDSDWGRSNAHGVDLRTCLVAPTRRIFHDPIREDETVELWLVLEEDPETCAGYKIVYGEDRRMFGLAMLDSGRCRDTFLGCYGSFLDAFDGM